MCRHKIKAPFHFTLRKMASEMTLLWVLSESLMEYDIWHIDQAIICLISPHMKNRINF